MLETKQLRYRLTATAPTEWNLSRLILCYQLFSLIEVGYLKKKNFGIKGAEQQQQQQTITTTATTSTTTTTTTAIKQQQIQRNGA